MESWRQNFGELDRLNTASELTRIGRNVGGPRGTVKGAASLGNSPKIGEQMGVFSG